MIFHSARLLHKVLFSAVIITAGVQGRSVQAESPATARVAPEDFAILPWGHTHGDEATYREVYECGFNLAGFVNPDKLDLVKAAGLKAIVNDSSIHVDDGSAGLSDDEITSRVNALAARTGKHPATYGYYLRDEPNAGLYPALGKWVAAFRKAVPNALPYVNLFPNYASAGQLGRSTYAEYLEACVEQVKPDFLSYDNYSLMDDGSLRDGYFQNLESVRAAALKRNLPFWNIVLSNAHFSYAEPSPAGLRFQAYTTLAYGARGISYFTYFAPSVGNYRLAPIDQFGNRTPTWDMLRNVNLQIHKLAPTLVKLKSVNVFHHPNVPKDCRGIDSAKYVSSVGGGQFLVGEFEGDGRIYAMIVNTSLSKSVGFGVTFKSGGPIEMIDAYSGRRLPWAGENVWLAAGQGMLLTKTP
jgi:hypothetical protein